MTAFAIGVDVLFRDPHLGRDALWRAGGSGDGVTVRVITRAPDDIVEWRESRVRTPTVFIDVRVSEVPILSKGDTFEIAGAVFAVTGAPERDSERLVWKAEAREG
ncbi:hypothetical protein [Paracoccus sp. J55]|uniref:head-tail joining protein n=1 Tax=Paracoccus sp. J55 TaxID=935849 RepID=UPI00048B2D2C|nr:hypothetical protein [Paracoccus sp. J55]